MEFVVAGLGILIVMLGGIGIVAPERFRALFHSMSGQARFLGAIVTRLAIGILFWVTADALRFPFIMRILAVISLAAAFVILIMGRERLDRLVEWWLARPDGLMRVSALFAATFGAFLVYVAV